MSTPTQTSLPASIAWMAKWERLSSEPALKPYGTGFDATGTFNPAAVRFMAEEGDSSRGYDKFICYGLLYRARDKKGISSIGWITSRNGINFDRAKTQALRPEAQYELGGGVEDPRLHKIGNRNYLTYTAYNGTDTAQLALAESEYYGSWKRCGVIIPAGEWGWGRHWTKSGAIVPVRIHDHWFMYYMADEGMDENMGADKKTDQMGIACSMSLLSGWYDVLQKPLLRRRKGFFDSRVVEPGPPPILTEHGILLFYNGADDSLTYRVGWVLFDSSNPTKVLARSDEPIFEPKLTWERSGQTPNVVFVEGCVEVEEEKRALFYYGAADTYVGVAEARK